MQGLMQWLDGKRCGLGGRMPDLVTLLEARLKGAVAVGSALVSEVSVPFADEILPNASAGRVAEFQAGRRAARRAMAALGVKPVSIPMASDRSPIWPSGLVGSISHCKGACLAVVSHADRIRGLGLDVEPMVDLPPDTWGIVLRPEEISAIGADAGKLALQIFVAKEAVYKAQYPISKCLFDFQTIRILFVEAGFTAEFITDVPRFPKGTLLSGVFVETDDILAALVVVT